MKGTQKIVLDSDAVNEAVQEYLQKRFTEQVVVTGTEAENKSRGTYANAAACNLTVTFTAEPTA